MTGTCDISGNKPMCIKNGTCPDPTSLRCLPHLSTLSGYRGKDGCTYTGYLGPYERGCRGGWRCTNNMCVQSANATLSKAACRYNCGAPMPVASIEDMPVRRALSRGMVHIHD